MEETREKGWHVGEIDEGRQKKRGGDWGDGVEIAGGED